MMSSPNFLSQLVDFGNTGKGLMNDETIEFLLVYIDIENFSPSWRKMQVLQLKGFVLMSER